MFMQRRTGYSFPGSALNEPVLTSDRAYYTSMPSIYNPPAIEGENLKRIGFMPSMNEGIFSYGVRFWKEVWGKVLKRESSDTGEAKTTEKKAGTNINIMPEENFILPVIALTGLFFLLKRRK